MCVPGTEGLFWGVESLGVRHAVLIVAAHLTERQGRVHEHRPFHVPA